MLSLTTMPLPLYAALLSSLLLAGCGQAPGKPPIVLPTPQTAGMHDRHARCLPQFRLLGEERWDLSRQFAGVPVGGLSGLDYRAADDRYYLVSDDRSTHDAARIYQAQIRYDDTGLHSVSLEQQHYLRTPQGTTYPSPRSTDGHTAVPDPEALRLLPGQNALVWSSEGDFAHGFGPSLTEAGLDGHWRRDWPLPAQLQLPTDRTTAIGPRNNTTLEGMAIDDDRQHLWLAMEGALRQDGPLPRPGHVGGPVRITQYDLATRQPVRQIAYVPDALPDDRLLLPLIAVNGISEILADGPHHLLVLERSYMLGRGFSVRIYRIRTDDAQASDTLHIDTLAPGHYQPVDKTLVLDLAQAGLATVDNLEAMTWGPPLANGQRVLLLVSDNNFNPAEVTQFVALAETQRCTAEITAASSKP